MMLDTKYKRDPTAATFDRIEKYVGRSALQRVVCQCDDCILHSDLHRNRGICSLIIVRKHLDRISETDGGEAWAMLMGLHVNMEVTAFFPASDEHLSAWERHRGFNLIQQQTR